MIDKKRIRRIKRIQRIKALRGCRLMSEHQSLLPLLLAKGKMTIIVDRITDDPQANNKSISLIREGGNILSCEIKGGSHKQRLTIHSRTPAEVKKAILQYQSKLVVGLETHRFDQTA